MAEKRFEDGIFLMHTDRFEEAVEFFKGFVDIDPSDVEAWYKLAVAYLGAGRLDEGQASAERAVDLRADDPELLDLLGGISSLKNDDEGALEFFDKAIEAKPDHVRGWISKVMTLRNLDRIDEAIVAYRQGIEKAPALRDPEEWNDLAGAIYDRGDYEATIDFLDFLLELEPEEASYKFNKLGPLSKLKRYEAVVELAEELVEEMPEFIPGWMVRGIALIGLERYEEAVESFDRAILLDPTGNEAREMKKRTLEYLDEVKKG
ncbi:tetratricopeptide repeat protein [Candidatus Methanocrinis natronophilus]|uniref:Tetratricopeptide repeat protein n=1 Tax=Candidatus Methanocrinis natronophilus TaxID=3033396 RepID=A0ABT5X577_9EURY|nr:tetratricopeptide repeat protein [Candidatus Methanocrinis natronophilus]MDF0589846.1 tetratricopeptide repeat protein [Candidatus Methanocrinis natronophilus]